VGVRVRVVGFPLPVRGTGLPGEAG
jgi:hypothetical protein